MKHLFLAAAAVICIGTHAIGQEPARSSSLTAPERREQKQLLKMLWDSIDTLAFECDEADVNEHGELQAPEKGFTRFTCAIGSGGRWAYTVTVVRPDGDELLDDMREDGHHKYKVRLAKDDHHRVERITIYKQSDTSSSYSDIMCTPLTLLVPFGQPLHTRIDDAKSLDWQTDQEHGKVLLLSFQGKSTPVDCELDSAHDWLPRSLVLEGFSETVVKRFERADGRWFPVEGITRYHNGTGRRASFRVKAIGFNRPLPATTFNPMSLATKGTLIVDRATETGRVVGGVKAIQKESAGKTREANNKQPVSVPAGTGGAPWGMLIGGVSVVILAVAYAISRRRR